MMSGRTWWLAGAVAAVAGLGASPVSVGDALASGGAGPTQGTVVAWGRNSAGQLGDGTTEDRRLAVGVTGLNGATAIAAGLGGTALLEAGTLEDWGSNEFGRLGDGLTSGPETCIEEVQCSRTPVAVPSLGEVVSISASENDTLALLKNGTVMAWGANSSGQLGNGSMADSAVPQKVPGLTEVVAIASGLAGSMALLKNGTVMVWGANGFGRLGIGATGGPELCGAEPCSTTPRAMANVSGAVAIGAGGFSDLAVLSDGSVMQSDVEPGPEPTDVNNVPAEVPGLGDVVSVAAGPFDNLALRGDGTVMSWGFNGQGQLGNGTCCTSSQTPSQVVGLSGVTAVAAGPEVGLALLGNGTVMSWGEGALGNETTTHSDVPVPVANVKNAAAIAAGGAFNLALISQPESTETATYTNWSLAGALKLKKLAQSITLPPYATFNGSAEVHARTGAGSVKGNLTIPAFTATLKFFGSLSVKVGVTLIETKELEGTVAKSEAAPGEETLTVPAQLSASVTSIGILGLTIPTKCAGQEPLSLSLTDTLTREELLTKGWSFAGTATVPKLKCEGGLLGALFGAILSAQVSGPENAYAIKITAPSG
jgi:alpha-tubulin suppressor-like RCC1 family protein